MDEVSDAKKKIINRVVGHIGGFVFFLIIEIVIFWKLFDGLYVILYALNFIIIFLYLINKSFANPFGEKRPIQLFQRNYYPQSYDRLSDIEKKVLSFSARDQFNKNNVGLWITLALFLIHLLLLSVIFSLSRIGSSAVGFSENILFTAQLFWFLGKFTTMEIIAGFFAVIMALFLKMAYDYVNILVHWNEILIKEKPIDTERYKKVFFEVK